MYIDPSAARRPASIVNSDDLPVEHLQLAPHVNRDLRRQGITTVGAAVDFSRGPGLRAFSYPFHVAECIAAIDQVRTDGFVDWPRYWGLRGWRLHHLCAFLEPLRRLSLSAREAPIDRTTFGNAGAMLRASGITNLGMLVDGLVPGLGEVRGLGRGKLVELFRALVRLSEQIDAAGNIRPEADLQQARAALVWPDLPEAVRQLPLSILHIGQKSVWLVRAGFATVGRILDAGPGELAGLEAVPATAHCQMTNLRLPCSANALAWRSSLATLPLSFFSQNSAVAPDGWLNRWQSCL